MLVAEGNDGLFTLTNEYSRNQLKEMRQKQIFTCPQCKEQLVLKIGQIKIPHFSHKTTTQCEQFFSERESAEHLLGKLQLFEFFQKCKGNVQIEAYLPQLEQRPDLLYEDDNKQFAIEFQCSPISSELLSHRTNGYISNKITPIWLLKTPFKNTYTTNSVERISLNAFQQKFILEDPTQRYLCTYAPEEKMFYYFTNLLQLQGNTFLCLVNKLPITHQIFPFYKPDRIPFEKFVSLMNKFFIYRESYLNRRLFLSRSGVQDILLRSIYELKLNRFQLPNYLGVPSRDMQNIPMFAVEWQAALFYFAKIKDQSLHQFNNSKIRDFLEWIHLEPTNQCVLAVNHYIKWLKEVGVGEITPSIVHSKLIESLYTHLVAIWCEN